MFPQADRDIAWPLAACVVLFGGLVLGGLAYQSVMGGVGERLVTVMLIDAIVVLGLQIYVGNTGVLSFGHIGFGAIAGYTFAVFAIAPAEKLARIPDAPFGLAEVDVSTPVAVVIAIVVVALIAIGGAT